MGPQAVTTILQHMGKRTAYGNSKDGSLGANTYVCRKPWLCLHVLFATASARTMPIQM